MDVPEEVTAAEDVDLSFCSPPCRGGETCRAFRCVGRDAGRLDGATSELPGVDVAFPSEPPVGSECCPLDPPSCGCVRAGGERFVDGTCLRVCGAGDHARWVRTRDASGCPIWQVPDVVCGDDAGPDAARDAPPDGRPGG